MKYIEIDIGCLYRGIYDREVAFSFGDLSNSVVCINNREPGKISDMKFSLVYRSMIIKALWNNGNGNSSMERAGLLML